MDKIKKISLTLLIWLLTLFFISIIQNRPVPITQTSVPFFQIPIIFWLVMLVSPFLLYLLSKDSKNPLIPLICVILYFFLFFSYGLYFMSHPTISDIGSSARFQEILSSNTHINPKDIELWTSASRYFQWPIFFIFSKIFTSILGIGPVLTLDLGFFSLVVILPVLLSFFYKKSDNVENIHIYFILPALYLTLAWYFINSQFVPQFLALIYLFILLGCYARYRDGSNPSFLILMIVFYILMVFSHAFVFIFFLVAIIFELYWSEYVEMKKTKYITYGLIIIFFAILFPYIGHYYSLASTGLGGESWRVIQSVLSQRKPIVPSNPLQSILIINQFIDQITRVATVLVISVTVIGLLFYLLKKRKLFDLSIIIGSISWFVLGLSRLVLGQRAIQVAALPLARHFKYPHKIFSYLSKIVVVIILISPSLFVANSVVNFSLVGDDLIQDFEENIAGRFLDNHITNKSIIVTAHNPYPTDYPIRFRKVGDTYFLKTEDERDRVDFILISPKLNKRLTYFGISFSKNPYDSIVYHNNEIKIFSN